MSHNKIKILVLGSTGMLGHMVVKVLSVDNRFHVFGTDMKKNGPQFYFDVLDGIDGLKKICHSHKHKFDYFINCIGITKNKIDETAPLSVARAITINSLFPHELAALASRYNSKVIQISTDGVFFKNVGVCYEDSPCDSDDIYGMTKRLGEVNNNNFLNIRCSIVGPSPFEKGGILEWLLSCLKDNTVMGYTNHRWNGVTTLQYAQLCHKIISKRAFDRIVKESNTHHFCPNKPVSKYKLLILLKTAFRKKVKIVPAKDKNGDVKRILASKYQNVRRIFGYDIPMQRAIMELADAVFNVEYLKK